MSEETQATTAPSSPTYNERAQEHDYLTGLKLFVILGSLTLVTFLVLLDTSIMGTAIPRITTEFHSLSDVGWYVGAYTLASATLQPLSGKFYTHFNTKIIFLAFVFTFELGSLVCGVANSSAVLIVGRAIAGLGAAGIINGAVTILSGAVPREKSPLYTGLLIGIAQMGIVLGPLLGGVLTERATWRWCFYINIPIGCVAAFILVMIRIPEVTKKAPFSIALIRKVIPDLDLIGFALFLPAAIMFLLALQFGSGNSFSWNSGTVIGLFCGAGVLAIIFILWERRAGDKAMLPGYLLRRRVIWTSCVFAACIMCCIIVASNWVPTYFQAVKGNGPSMSGVHVLPSILGQLLFVVVSGAAVSRMGYYLPWALFSGIVTAIGNGLLSTFTASTSVATWIGYQIVLGVGRGGGLQMAMIAVQNAVLPSEYPVAIANQIFFQNLGTSIAIVICNTIFAQTLISTIPRYAPSVSPQAALEAGSGAGAVRALVPAGHKDELDGVLRAYSESLRNVFYFLVGIASLMAVASLGMGWKDVSKKVDKKTGDVVIEEKLVQGKEVGEA
ncbi:efflux pump protein [Clathrospora elynae]|uniref:Efflux pump protein n=1 Tax=Clathrospora elynae TaxID=706981 RepID=A0A6A5SX83_9PLEO|nr:efflux pump protein [Clathrospora elynae]